MLLKIKDVQNPSRQTLPVTAHPFLEQDRSPRASCPFQQPKPQHLLPTDRPAPGVGASTAAVGDVRPL